MSQVARELDRMGKYKTIATALNRATSTASAYQDLRVAVESLELLRRLTTETEWQGGFSLDEAGTLAGSLFDTAIIMYARATDTKPIARQKWFGIDKLSPEQRPTHRAVMWLRDKELAHFGKGTPVDGTPLIEEALVLVDHGASTSLGYRANRARNRGQFSSDFRKLALAVAELGKQASGKRFEEALVAVGEATAVDQDFIDLIQRHPITERLTFGAHERAVVTGGAAGLVSYVQTVTIPSAVKVSVPD